MRESAARWGRGSMFQSKKANLIISLVLAVALWFYVVGQLNPETRRTFRHINVKTINEQVLTDEGLAVVDVSVDTVSVQVTGKRTAVNSLTESSFKAKIDLSDAAEGTNQLKISITAPDSVEVIDQSSYKATVTVEKRVSETRDVSVQYTGNEASGTEPTTTDISPSQVTVSGSQSQVDQVASVVAKVSAENISDGESSQTASLTPVNSRGKTVDNISLSTNKATVTSVLRYTKEVSLDVPVTGTDDNGYKRTVKAPDTITIKGDSSTIDDIDQIKAQTIDLSDVKKNTKIKITPILPDGVEAADDSEELYLTVTVKAEEEGDKSKTFTLSGSDVDLNDAEDGLDARVETGSIKVTVSGKESKISDISESDISLSADLSGLDAGEHSVKVSASAGSGVSVSVSPETIKVNLE